MKFDFVYIITQTYYDFNRVASHSSVIAVLHNKEEAINRVEQYAKNLINANDPWFLNENGDYSLDNGYPWFEGYIVTKGERKIEYRIEAEILE